MPNIDRNIMYMKIAYQIATQSYCERRKVGSVLVKNGQIISDGFNGTPESFDNCCEIDPDNTKPEVLHAEANALAKVGKSTNSSYGATMYVTLSPCFECSKLLIQFGIKEVYYSEEYRDLSGIALLKKKGIKVERIILDDNN
jgi:dCMP deaminase